MIDTGDIVRHIPTGEMWVVACVIGDKLIDQLVVYVSAKLGSWCLLEF